MKRRDLDSDVLDEMTEQASDAITEAMRMMPAGTRATAFSGPVVSAARLWVEWGLAPTQAPEPAPYRVEAGGSEPQLPWWMEGVR